ncbi:TetR family transcriptional regulator [Streptomyces sp. AJS327]|uniref:TetR/AcrR family transcriptional regulator n=1 Tax=Streptomyces sp. AJS327 TaxID=2545265 RepID=UPI0015DE9ACC|nr:TetR family transcriptional regulator [Streptomyces sp. AJS327]MBA0049851.1 TetR family transcriptional regulator [Streptomyces sp. AJS327]
MVRNPERRTALIDAAIEVLARDGARGLTFRAVDTEAEVPTGTASNYFASRDDLFTQVGGRVRLRMTPDPHQVTEAMSAPPSRELVTELMVWLVERMAAERTGYLAMLELRLEATRRPELRAQLHHSLRAELAENLRFHEDAGLPGGADHVLTLYFAMTGLLLDHLTTPGILEGRGPTERLVENLVQLIIPPE